MQRQGAARGKQVAIGQGGGQAHWQPCHLQHQAQAREGQVASDQQHARHEEDNAEDKDLQAGEQQHSQGCGVAGPHALPQLSGVEQPQVACSGAIQPAPALQHKLPQAALCLKEEGAGGHPVRLPARPSVWVLAQHQQVGQDAVLCNLQVGCHQAVSVRVAGADAAHAGEDVVGEGCVAGSGRGRRGQAGGGGWESGSGGEVRGCA